jgi:hypothetical protein
MLKFAHIINPVIVGVDSDLFIAQPITFETMRLAKEYSSQVCDVELFATTFPEDSDIVPLYFSKTVNLERSILDIGVFKIKRKLPLLKDILDRLYESSDADYFIYTNVDIALQPFFYSLVVNFIENKFDGFIINRRTIDKGLNTIESLPIMLSQSGEIHPGLDCFIFKRDIYPRFILKNGSIGAIFIGKILAWNLAIFSDNFYVFKDLHATFHIGKDRIWQSVELEDYKTHNQLQAIEVLKDLEKVQKGSIDLLKKLDLIKPTNIFIEFLKNN